MKLSRQEKTFLTNLFRKTPDTFVETTLYKFEGNELTDIRENEIKNRAVTDMFEPIDIEKTISSESGKVEEKEWMKGIAFIKVKVWKKLCKAYIDGYESAVKQQQLRSSDIRYASIGMKGGIDAAVAYVNWVNQNNQRLNEKYNAAIPVMDVDKEKQGIISKLKIDLSAIKNIFKK